MPAGRSGHKIREFKRRVDALLEAERVRHKPPPPPISEEHAALRGQIAEAFLTLLDARDPEDPEGSLEIEKIRESPELRNAARKFMDLQLKERDFLAEHGVDWRPYQR
jgi:hypothetical protein